MKPSPQSPSLRASHATHVRVTPFGALRHTAKRAFTLLEIMVVVVIIGIVATIAVTSLDLTGTSNEAKREATRVTLNRVASAVELYKIKNNDTPSFDRLISAKFLKKQPKDAWGGTLTIQQDGSVTAANTPVGKITSGE